jgi:hypothetical protein
VKVLYNGHKEYKRPRIEVIAMKLVMDAIYPQNKASERTLAACAIMDRMEGRPVQPIRTVAEPEIILNISTTEARL